MGTAIPRMGAEKPWAWPKAEIATPKPRAASNPSLYISLSMGLTSDHGDANTPNYKDDRAGPLVARRRRCFQFRVTRPFARFYAIRILVQSPQSSDERVASEFGAESSRGQEKSENPSSFCPVCSARLEAHKCKLRCPACGYYMSCSDYY